MSSVTKLLTEKEKKAKENGGVNKPITPKTSVELTEKIETWCGEDEKLLLKVFVKIASCGSELLAVVYMHGNGSHSQEIALHIPLHLVSYQIRATAIPLSGDDVAQLFVSNHLAVVRTSSNVFYWCGLYPFTDRHKLWEKERAKSRKHVTFETGEIVEGNEVRTKATPIYTAGSVAINLAGSSPVVSLSLYIAHLSVVCCVYLQVGVLMESVWTLTEMCRFRVMDPSTYDTDFPKATESTEDQKLLPATGESRKRRASQDVFDTVPLPREEAWGVSEVVWIHEQHTQDTAVVKIVDGAYVGVEYVTAIGDMTYASSLSGGLSKDSSAPQVFDILLCFYQFVMFCFVLEIYAILFDSHQDSILLLRDGNGALLPLIRDALMGFREPLTLHQPPIKHVSLAVHPVSSSATNKNGSRRATVLAIASPSSAAGFAKLPSLMQTVLYADAEGVKNILNKLEEIGDPDLLIAEVVDARSDGGANVVHAAVRLAVAAKNKEDADPGTTHGLRLREDETRLAAEEARALDQRWQRLLRSNRGGEKKDGENIEQDGVFINLKEIYIFSKVIRNYKKNKPFTVVSSISVERPVSEILGMLGEETIPAIGIFVFLIYIILMSSESTFSFFLYFKASPFGRPVCDVKERQRGAMDTVKQIVSHPVVAPLLAKILSHRDVGGLTPFMSAINHRAYGAAVHIWDSIESLVKNKPDDLPQYIHPTGCRPDDSPLFVLCYNDTCSFTWTGEEHINQVHLCDFWNIRKITIFKDIFECRTCGLTGSLCCCTECAFTCHRNHDCKLKRTSPTAYCDCWEKCPCKALVAGNQEKREFLLTELLKKTKLHELTNNRGEHVMLFLARTIGRQQNEQANYPKRRRNPAGTSTGDASSTPEHDLDPPKFAQFALKSCLQEWDVVKSLACVGIRGFENDQPVMEDVLHINSQSGSSHIDKFVFTLLSKCCDKYAHQLIDCLINMVNTERGPNRDSMVDKVVARYVRSVIRLYVMCILLSPVAAATAIAGEAPSGTNSLDRRHVYQTIPFSGFLSIVRKDSQCGRESKNQAIAPMVLRCRTVLLRLSAYSGVELAAAADAVLVPVRLGVLRPSVPLTVVTNQDSLEVIEKFLCGESDLTTMLSRAEDAREKIFRKRKISRRDTDREEEEPRRDESEDDSDSDEPNRRKSGVVVMNERGDDDMETSSEDEDEEEEEEGHVMVEDDENMEDEEADDDERVEGK
uniref:UBR-type domain-containing protein n=1 Tax=Heterorhabditis bacteriophora TaxID=37862 RepID=A0A1I7X6L1_HETBA